MITESLAEQADRVAEQARAFRRNLARCFDAGRQQRILEVALDQARLEAMPVRDFMDLLAA